MANEYLQRTPTSTGNRRVFTISFWTKRSTLSGSTPRYIFNTGSGTAEDTWFAVTLDNDGVSYDSLSAGTWTTGFGFVQSQTGTTAYLRDSSSWMHILISIDTTKDQASDRGLFYINGVLMKHSISTVTKNASLAQNNSGIIHRIGARNDSGPRQYYDAELTDVFFVDGQALTPDVFGFYKQGKGYISAGSTQATDFRPGQWVPKTPRVIKTEINRRGGFGVNGFYLPMNDSRNFGADFHCDPNSIITLNEKLPQPRVGVATTASVGLGYTDALRADPFAANLVLALPFVSGGLNSGFGDYSHIIRGSGSAKSITVSGNTTIANVGTAETASVFYGSGAKFDGADDFLTIPNSSDFSFGSGDFTVECWANFGNFSAATSLVNVFENATARRSWSIEGRANGAFRFEWWYDGSTSQSIDASTNTLSRGQWNHFAMVRKGTAITGYINGVAIGIKTDVGSQSLFNNTTDPLVIGALFTSGTPVQDFTGYIQDLRIYKGVAKYTGGFDVPRPYTPVGIATWRAVPDCTANNFATLNRLYNSVSGNVVLADGNLTYTGSQTPSYGLSQATVGVSTNKWYWEVRVGATGPSIGVGVVRSGVNTSSYTGNPETSFVGAVDGSIGFYHSIANTVYYWTGTALATVSYTIPSCTTGDVISVALDLTGGTNSKIYFAKNGNWGASGDPATGTNPVGLALSGTYLPAISIGAAGASTAYLNFGQNPTFSGNTTAGTFTDSNGKGLFKYQPPSGFLALCEDNLPTPAISDPGKHFKTMLYTGDGNNGRSIVGVGFTPDLVWIKSRNATGFHQLMDSVRGAGIQLYSNDTSAESAGLYQSSFDRDGFSINYNSSGATNNSGTTYAAWCWRAGAGTTSTNTNGSITSVVSVNQDAGFSIVSWSGTGSAGTIGHGLGKTPAFRINKYRDSSTNWYVWHKSLAANEFLMLNQTTAKTGSSSLWNNTLPTSTTISYTTATTGERFIEYVWAEIEGFSKFGSWVSNANADGPFIYCGFKPALVICKTVSGDVSNWVIADSSRSSVNDGSTSSLRANTSDTEATAAGGFTIDFLSNGFKLRQSGALNSTGLTNIFAAWAESPFTTANAK